MRTALLMSITLFVPALAFAQDAPQTAAIDVGDTVFAVGETPSTRFPDADEEGPTFTAESRLVVLVSEANRLRVMAAADNSFGWIPASTVTKDKPELDMEELLKSLGAGSPGDFGAGGGAAPQ